MHSPRLTLLVLTAFTPLGAAPAQIRLTQSQVVEDLRTFVHALEETHPDPYTAFGGKVSFKLRVQDLLASVPEEGLSPDGMAILLAPMLATLGDGHTSLRSPVGSEDRPARFLPVAFAVAADAVFVTAAAQGYEWAIGARLVGVDDVSLAEFKQLAAGILPTENQFGVARAAARAIGSTQYLRRILGRDVDSVRVRLLGPEGGEVERPLPFFGEGEAPLRRPGSSLQDFDGDASAIWWRYFDAHHTAYLRLVSIEAREAFEDVRGRQDLPQYLGAYYRRYLHRDAPASVDTAIAGVPCLTAAVADLLTTMRDHHATHLIVDLRGNGGGWSSLGLPLYLLLYGNGYLDHVFPDAWIDVASPQYLELNAWTAENLHAVWGKSYEVGDYRRRNSGAPRADRSDEEVAQEMESYGCGLADWYRRLNGRPLYRPTVLVLVDTGTFSAAFQVAYHLQQLGAQVLGVPPAQAGNAFTNVVPFELPNSHLRGSIARSLQLYFPDDTTRGRTLRPEFPATWDVYARYGFDAQSEVRYALDLIDAGRIRPRTPPQRDPN